MLGMTTTRTAQERVDLDATVRADAGDVLALADAFDRVGVARQPQRESRREPHGLEQDRHALARREATGERDVAARRGVTGFLGQRHRRVDRRHTLLRDRNVLDDPASQEVARCDVVRDVIGVEAEPVPHLREEGVRRALRQVAPTVVQHDVALVSAEALRAHLPRPEVRRHGTGEAVVGHAHHDRDAALGAAREDPGRDERIELVDVDDVGSERLELALERADRLACVDAAGERADPTTDPRRQVAAVAHERADLESRLLGHAHRRRDGYVGTAPAAVAVVGVEDSHALGRIRQRGRGA
ncbi:MAG: hypothetical protein R3F34_04530 [Planctomycetota bacterium]